MGSNLVSVINLFPDGTAAGKRVSKRSFVIAMMNVWFRYNKVDYTFRAVINIAQTLRVAVETGKTPFTFGRAIEGIFADDIFHC